MIYCILLTTHLLADFTFQPAALADKKKESFRFLLLHSLIYFTVFIGACFLLIDARYAWLPALLISLLHFAVDWLRKELTSRFKNEAFNFTMFVGDQIIHIAVILAILFLFQIDARGNTLYHSAGVSDSFQNIVLCVLLFVIIWDPAAVFIKKLLRFISSAASGAENLRVGNIIGKLERIITAILVLCGQYGVIGLVLTAKSIARYKQLDDKVFAERYLVGTLASLTIALAASIVIKRYLQ